MYPQVIAPRHLSQERDSESNVQLGYGHTQAAHRFSVGRKITIVRARLIKPPSAELARQDFIDLRSSGPD
jgi:hypothetical protein